jgi:topoisomerase-4 subunit B
MTQQYDESSVRVLKGLEPVKERPGMYTRTTDPTHICQEVIDNAADEALGGYARKIAVTVHQDGSLSVEDDGAVFRWACIRKRACRWWSWYSPGCTPAASSTRKMAVLMPSPAVCTAWGIGYQCAVHPAGSGGKARGGVHRLVFSGGDVIEPLARIGDCGARTSGTAGTGVAGWQVF